MSDHRAIFSIQVLCRSHIVYSVSSGFSPCHLLIDLTSQDIYRKVSALDSSSESLDQTLLKTQAPETNVLLGYSRQSSDTSSGSSMQSLLTSAKSENEKMASLHPLTRVLKAKSVPVPGRHNSNIISAPSKPLGQFLQSPVTVPGGEILQIKDQRKAQQAKSRQPEALKPKISTSHQPKPAAQSDVSVGRVVWRQDIDIGDYVEVHKLGSADKSTDQGFIAEV